MQEAITKASKGLEARFQEQPEIESGLRLLVGKALWSLMDREQAQLNLRRAYELLSSTLGETNADSIDAKSRFGWSFVWGNSVTSRDETVRATAKEGRRLMEGAFAAQMEVFGPEEGQTLDIAGRLMLHYANELDMPEADAVASLLIEAVRGLKENSPAWMTANREEYVRFKELSQRAAG